MHFQVEFAVFLSATMSAPPHSSYAVDMKHLTTGSALLCSSGKLFIYFILQCAICIFEQADILLCFKNKIKQNYWGKMPKPLQEEGFVMPQALALIS